MVCNCGREPGKHIPPEKWGVLHLDGGKTKLHVCPFCLARLKSVHRSASCALTSLERLALGVIKPETLCPGGGHGGR